MLRQQHVVQLGGIFRFSRGLITRSELVQNLSRSAIAESLGQVIHLPEPRSSLRRILLQPADELHHVVPFFSRFEQRLQIAAGRIAQFSSRLAAGEQCDAAKHIPPPSLLRQMIDEEREANVPRDI